MGSQQQVRCPKDLVRVRCVATEIAEPRRVAAQVEAQVSALVARMRARMIRGAS